MKKINATRVGFVSSMAFFAVLFAVQNASAAITSSLDIGSRGQDVTQLQTYLATNPSFYPSGLITGYFGALTQAGVQSFQSEQGIVSAGTPATTGYGRVGPQTMAKLNVVMGAGNTVSIGDAPILGGIFVQYSTSSAALTWTTNVPTQGQVYWDVTTIRSDEATGPQQQPYISGSLSSDAAGLQTSHAVTILNLQPNTSYFYVVRGIDSAGNVSMTSQNTFHTSQ